MNEKPTYEELEKQVQELKAAALVHEQAMAAQQKSLDSIIKYIPDIIYRLDSQGRITFISESVRTYGYDPAEMIGTSMLDYVHSEASSRALRTVFAISVLTIGFISKPLTPISAALS